MKKTVAGKLVLVTGAAQGLAAANCRRLTDYGRLVIATDQNKARLSEMVESVSKEGGIIEGCVMDVSEHGSVSDWFPDVDPSLLQDPKNVTETVIYVLCQPDETVIPEVLVIPMKETSWP